MLKKFLYYFVLIPVVTNIQIVSFIESPKLKVVDGNDGFLYIAALVDAAHKRGVLVAVDNTTATVLSQTPLETRCRLLCRVGLKRIDGPFRPDYRSCSCTRFGMVGETTHVAHTCEDSVDLVDDIAQDAVS